jgi:hypothetical protein
MVFKIALPLLLLCSCTTTAKPLDINHEVKYAISYCLSSAYLESQFSKDAGYVSGAYIQKGSYGLHVYESIRGFVDLYTAKKYNSKHNKNLIIMQCIDLNDSIELVEIIHTSLKNG